MKSIALGQSSFRNLIAENGYFVDKTRFIADLLNGPLVKLVTRPRRFGKTLTLSMLQSFLELNYADPDDTSSTQSLFYGLDILQNVDFCKNNLGRWPVISVSFKSIEGDNCAEALQRLKSVLAFEARRFTFLLQSDQLDEYDKRDLQALVDLRRLPEHEALIFIPDALMILQQALTKHFKKKPIVLIDEYDIPLIKARSKGYYPEMLKIMRQILGMTLKDSSVLRQAVLTGCLRLAKESIFTGTNNFTSYGIGDQPLSQLIGFTKDETLSLLRYFDLEKHAQDVQTHYDGYRFGNSDLYCPWDVLNFCEHALGGSNSLFKSYWFHTSSDELIHEFIDWADSRHLDMLSDLMQGKTISASIDDAMSLTELDDRHQPEQLMSLLYATGYITRTETLDNGQARLRIPNASIEACFRHAIANYFTTSTAQFSLRAHHLLEAFLSGDISTAQTCLQTNLERYISVRDSTLEVSYHMFLLGMLTTVVSTLPKVALMSNRESGQGYPDLVITDTAHSRVAILEIKRTRSSQDLERAAQLAIEQISNRNYVQEYNTFKSILRFGVAFCGKRCLIRIAPFG